MPFLADGIDDEDEVLTAVAGALGDLVPHVGGPGHAAALLGPLELLLAVEANAVREAAAASALAVSQQMSDMEYEAAFVGMIGRLAVKEWFTARISACRLVPPAYPRMMATSRTKHLRHFAALCQDDAPMVRRIAARHLGPLLYAVAEDGGPAVLEENGAIAGILLGLYEALAGGDQPDSVRLHTTQNCVEFGRAMGLLSGQRPLGSASPTIPATPSPRVDCLVHRVLPLVVATIDDRSWRVRWTAASRFAAVVDAFAPLSGAMDALVPAYEKLLQDPEAEVRTAAALNLSAVARTGVDVLPAGWSGTPGDSEGDDGRRVPVAHRLVKRVLALTEDDSESVRAALASVATDLAPLLGKDLTIVHLLPPLLLLLRDATAEVRLNIVTSLSLLHDSIGTELLTQSLLPAVLDLAEDGKWRIRLAVIERIPLLARQLGKEFFAERLLALCVGWLSDAISSIRAAAAANLKELTSLLGAEWAVQHLLPRVKGVTEDPSYLRRMHAVRALTLMGTAMDVRTAQWEVLPLLLEAYGDPVPNVRFNVARGLGSLGPMFGSTVYQGQITPVLEVLKEDPDRDVRYFANESSDLLSAEFEKR